MRSTGPSQISGVPFGVTSQCALTVAGHLGSAVQQNGATHLEDGG